jgi:hypothetical protein
MDKYKKQIAIFIGISILWHGYFMLNEKKSLAGIFMSKPESGYAWEGTTSTGSRFFWMNTDVNWKEGIKHDEYKAVTSKDEGIWNPEAGYQFIDKAKSLETIWKEGLLHPNFKAYSDHGEGIWKPATGYKFIYEGDTFIDTVWEPGKRDEDQKVIALTQQDTFKPFSGYQFVDEANSIKVVWVPGTPNSDNANLYAGTKEGTWEAQQNVVYRRSRRSSLAGELIKAHVVNRVIDRALFYR